MAGKESIAFVDVEFELSHFAMLREIHSAPTALSMSLTIASPKSATKDAARNIYKIEALKFTFL